jgi:hypothetical protein
MVVVNQRTARLEHHPRAAALERDEFTDGRSATTVAGPAHPEGAGHRSDVAIGARRLDAMNEMTWRRELLVAALRAERSRAGTWGFSSTHNTNARSGASRRNRRHVVAIAARR